MPLNEAAGYRRNWLTKEQQREQEAALYGLPTAKEDMQLTQEQAAQMRQLLAQFDQQNGGNAPKEFDLHNPPKVPYKFQEYPRCMYHPDGRVKNANSEAEMNEALANGWSKEPVTASVQPVLENGAGAVRDREAAPPAPPAAEAKKKPGRKPKAEAEPTPTE